MQEKQNKNPVHQDKKTPIQKKETQSPSRSHQSPSTPMKQHSMHRYLSAIPMKQHSMHRYLSAIPTCQHSMHRYLSAIPLKQHLERQVKPIQPTKQTPNPVLPIRPFVIQQPSQANLAVVIYPFSKSWAYLAKKPLHSRQVSPMQSLTNIPPPAT